MRTNAAISSICKLILKTNSKPDTSSFSFFLALIKKLDSASQRPTNHSINFKSKDDLSDSLWTSYKSEFTSQFEFILLL